MSTPAHSPTSIAFRPTVAFVVACLTVAASTGVATAQEASDDSGETNEQETSEAKAEESTETSGEESSETTPEDRASKLLANAQRLYHEGQWYSARKGYKKAFEQAPEGSKLRVQAALGRSMLLWEQGGYASARKWVDRAMKLAEKHDLDSVIGRLLLTMGHIEASRGQLNAAEGTLGKCVELAAAQNDATFGALCKLNHRMVRKLQGEAISSEAAYQKALKTLESSDSPLRVGLSLAKTAQLYSKGGQQNRAYNLLNRAGKQYEKVGSVPAQARNRMLKAKTLQNMGQWGKARQHLEGIFETFQKLGNRPAMVDALGLLGTDARHRGSYDEARSYFKRALEIAQSIGNPQKIGRARIALCQLGARSGSFDTSSSHCRSAIETFEKRGMSKLVAIAQSSLGRAAQTAGKLKTARKALLAAIETRDEKVHPRLQTNGAVGRDRANVCQIEMRMEATGVLTRCRRALDDLSSDVHSQFTIGTTHYALGNAASKKKKPKVAAEHLGKAAEAFGETSPPNHRRIVDAKMRQGLSFRRAGKTKRAAAAFKEALGHLSKAEKNLATLEVQIRTQYGQLLLDQDSWKKAATQLQKLTTASRKAGDTGSRAWAYSALARAQQQLGNSDEALESLDKALPLAREAGDQKLIQTIENNKEAFAD